jgi:hypothetical protein
VEVVEAYRAHLRAMVEGDTDSLDELLDGDFTLSHMTGYVQPKGEWLAQIHDGQFDYHDVEEKDVTVEVEGSTAHLVGRTVTDATVYGTRAPWRLQLALDYARTDGEWIALRSVGSSW